MFHFSGAQDDLPPDYCHDMPFGGYKRHPYDCGRYVTCWSRTNFHIQSCQEGLMYDEQLGFCNYGPLVDCGNSPRPGVPAPTIPRLPPTRPPTTRRDGGFLREVSVSHRRPAPSKETVLRGDEPDMVHAVHQEDLSNFIKVVEPPRAPRNNQSELVMDLVFDASKEKAWHRVYYQDPEHSAFFLSYA